MIYTLHMTTLPLHIVALSALIMGREGGEGKRGWGRHATEIKATSNGCMVRLHSLTKVLVS